MPLGQGGTDVDYYLTVYAELRQQSGDGQQVLRVAFGTGSVKWKKAICNLTDLQPCPLLSLNHTHTTHGNPLDLVQRRNH